MYMFDSSLIKTTISNLSRGGCEKGATTIGNYALFGGGGSVTAYSGSLTTSQGQNTVEAYNSSLIKISAPNMLCLRNYCTAISTNDYALFAGGDNAFVVDAYNSNLVHFQMGILSISRIHLDSVIFNNYIVFIGGTNSARGADYYTPSLIKISTEAFNLVKFYPAASVFNNYILMDRGLGTSRIQGGATSYNQILVGNFNYKSSKSSKILVRTESKDIDKSLGKLLIPKSSEASNTDDIFIGTNSTSPTVSNATVKKSGIIASGTIYIFIKKSLFEFSNYGDAESAANALNYLTVIAHSSTTGNSKHYSFTTGSNHTSTHYQFVLTNVASPFRIYLQN